MNSVHPHLSIDLHLGEKEKCSMHHLSIDLKNLSIDGWKNVGETMRDRSVMTQTQGFVTGTRAWQTKLVRPKQALELQIT
ncbi:Uncharacterized protein TCM_009325 [Theobroma cacao]|uniref:Uncharacterized protein n=1 Tax=Theobroma cacao TaxID=3641 RepID=A0A061E6L6_THECC|nr:Uncharacterized protein TCM_009325 [Theobroma cacao]